MIERLLSKEISRLNGSKAVWLMLANIEVVEKSRHH